MIRVYALPDELVAKDVAAVLSAVGYYARIWRGMKDTVRLETDAQTESVDRAEVFARAHQ